MKKILFVTTNDWIEWGGSEELWFETAKYFLQNKFEVAVCIKKRDSLPPKLIELNKFNYIRYIFKKTPSNFFYKIYKKLSPQKFNYIFDNAYKKEIIKWNPCIAIVSQGNNLEGVDFMLFLKENNIKYSTICHAAYEGLWPDSTQSKKMEKAYSGSIYNYFVSQANLSLTEIQIGNKITNKKIVRNPFNVPYENVLAFPDNFNYKLACVARYEFYAKGQDVLLEVLSQKKWKERNLLVNLYGSGKNEEGIRKLIGYFNLSNVLLNGFTPTIDIWKENHGLILPSRFEGLPLAIVEAMLCGRFGIVTNVSGNKEVIIDNINGFIAEAPLAEYLDKALERAWQRRSEWEEIGLKAQTYIKTLVPSNPGEEFFNEIQLSNNFLVK